MSEVNITDSHILFRDGKTQKILLNVNDFFQNKSRIPMHTNTEDGETISKFLTNTIRRNRELLSNITPTKEMVCLIINSLVISELIKSAAPIKMAEFGSTNGDISYNLMETLGKFHPDSTLCLISNTIGNESGNNCLNCITQATLYPEFSMVYSDYAKTNLADNCFDIVFINGDACNDDHYAILKEAERITKPDGLLICWTSGDYLMESTVKLIFSEREEYALTAADKVLTARKTANCWSNCTSDDPYTGLSGLLEALTADMQSDTIDTYRPYIKQLNRYIDAAIEKYDIKKKLLLIEIKNSLHDYMNNLTTSHRIFYQNKLNSLLCAEIKQTGRR